LAELMSSNPVSLTGEQIANMSRPREVMVTKIDLDSDPGVKKDLKNVSAHQARDPRIE
jgi:hypothetical protein